MATSNRPARGPLAAAVLLFALVAALYLRHLPDAPVYLAHDEIKFALQARSIAATGRDLNGVFLPVYFSEPEFRGGRDPMIIYAMALVLKVLPLSEMAIRLPTALVGILDVVLMFFVARRLFSSGWIGVIGAGLLATTPAHFIHARFGLDILYPLPFVLGWLLCLSIFLEGNRRAWLIASSVCLGVGIYSYLPAIVMMPMFLAFTCVAVRQRPDRVQLWAWAVLGFALPLAPLVTWQITHPTRIADLIVAYRPPGTAAARSASATTLGAIETYWNFFNPSFLFFAGDSSLVNSTRGVGVFLLPIAALWIVGIHRIATGPRSLLIVALLGGLASAPLAASAMGVVEIRRALLMLPFGILIAVYGVEALLVSRRRLAQAVLLILLAVAALQFRGFYVDYFGAHRIRSGIWLGGNIRGAVTSAIAAAREQPSPAIYLSDGIPYLDAYWSFYSLAQGAGDLHAVGYDPARLDNSAIPSGALRVSDAAEFVRSGGDVWQAVRAISELEGQPTFVVSRRR